MVIYTSQKQWYTESFKVRKRSIKIKDFNFEQSFHFSHFDVSFKYILPKPPLQLDFQFSFHQNCCITFFSLNSFLLSLKVPLKLHFLGNNFFNHPIPWQSLLNSSVPPQQLSNSFLRCYVCVSVCLSKCLVSFATLQISWDQEPGLLFSILIFYSASLNLMQLICNGWQKNEHNFFSHSINNIGMLLLVS